MSSDALYQIFSSWSILLFHTISFHSSYKIHQLFTDYLLRLPSSELLEKRVFRSRANRRLVVKWHWWWVVMGCDRLWWGVMRCDSLWCGVMRCDAVWDVVRLWKEAKEHGFNLAWTPPSSWLVQDLKRSSAPLCSWCSNVLNFFLHRRAARSWPICSLWNAYRKRFKGQLKAQKRCVCHTETAWHCRTDRAFEGQLRQLLNCLPVKDGRLRAAARSDGVRSPSNGQRRMPRAWRWRPRFNSMAVKGGRFLEGQLGHGPFARFEAPIEQGSKASQKAQKRTASSEKAPFATL